MHKTPTLFAETIFETIPLAKAKQTHLCLFELGSIFENDSFYSKFYKMTFRNNLTYTTLKQLSLYKGLRICC